MRAGRLDKRVQLQSATEARDSHGQPIKTWTTQATVWAGVEPLRGAEKVAAMQMGAYRQLDVIIRYRSDVTEDWRILYGTRELEIKSVVNEYERDRMLKIRCLEVV